MVCFVDHRIGNNTIDYDQELNDRKDGKYCDESLIASCPILIIFLFFIYTTIAHSSKF